MQRHCALYKAADGRWYMELAHREYAERVDSTTYGPFSSLDTAEAFLSSGFSNPGGWEEDDSGTRPVPARSPDGGPVVRPSTLRRLSF